jgi:hypothetical protein
VASTPQNNDSAIIFFRRPYVKKPAEKQYEAAVADLEAFDRTLVQVQQERAAALNARFPPIQEQLREI